MQDAPYRLIPLRGRGGIVRAEVKVDAADYEWLSQHRWCLANNGYAARRLRRTSRHVEAPLVLMHREILGLVKGDGLQADHINRDKLDNRRANLRVVTQGANAQNKAGYGSSRYRGVSYHKASGGWTAQHKFHGRIYYLGYFLSEQAAAEAAAAFRAEHFPYAED